VLTLPVIDALKACYPTCIVDFLVNKRVYDLVFDYPNINKVHAIEKVTIGGIKQIALQGKYDLAVCVFPRFKIALGLFLAGINHRLGTGYRWYSFLFNLKHYQHRQESIKHENEYNLDLLEAVNCQPDKQLEPELKVTDEQVGQLRVDMNSAGINIDVKFIVVHVPSLGSAKVWSDDNFISLLNLILNDKLLDHDIFLTGTKDDIYQVKHIAAGTKNSSRVKIIPELSLKGLAALLSNSEMFIGNSTGPIHIAAAVGTFVVGLYSAARAESQVRWGPLTERKKVFSPVIDDNSRNVMDDIKPEEVFAFIKNYFLMKIKEK
jgi:heptosyltransferase III